MRVCTVPPHRIRVRTHKGRIACVYCAQGVRVRVVFVVFLRRTMQLRQAAKRTTSRFHNVYLLSRDEDCRKENLSWPVKTTTTDSHEYNMHEERICTWGYVRMEEGRLRRTRLKAWSRRLVKYQPHIARAGDIVTCASVEWTKKKRASIRNRVLAPLPPAIFHHHISSFTHGTEYASRPIQRN